jgi:hypothetical protein
MLPTYIGIGAPKAATTWLAKCLSEHPDVFMVPKKETSFFDWDTIDGRVSRYEAEFESVEEETAVGELSTRYLASERAPARVHRLLPDVDLFVSLRDPVEQIQSHYWHLHRQNFHQWDREKVPDSFGEALRQYEDKLLGPARYYTHLRRWLQYFDRSQLLILFYDDIQNQPKTVLQELYEHLGVNPNFEPPSLERQDSSTRRGVSPRGETLDRIRRIIYDFANRKVYQSMKSSIGKDRARKIKEAMNVRGVIESIFMKKGYPNIKHKNKKKIMKVMREEIGGIENITGRRLVSWKKKNI